MNFFLIVGSIGCLTIRIVILDEQGNNGGATPWLVPSAGLSARTSQLHGRWEHRAAGHNYHQIAGEVCLVSSEPPDVS